MQLKLTISNQNDSSEESENNKLSTNNCLPLENFNKKMNQAHITVGKIYW